MRKYGYVLIGWLGILLLLTSIPAQAAENITAEQLNNIDQMTQMATEKINSIGNILTGIAIAVMAIAIALVILVVLLVVYVTYRILKYVATEIRRAI